MKVLFLDLDGVLNSERTCLAFGARPHHLNERHLWDPVALELVRKLEKAGVRIVLSSSWREAYSLVGLGLMLGLSLFDKTPSSSTLKKRGWEIAAWLKQYEGNVTHYAIVDDMMDMLPEQTKYFVKTSDNDGLRYADFCDICRLLDINPLELA